MSESADNSEGKPSIRVSHIQNDCFGELNKAEDVRWNSNQLALYGAKNADAWQKNSKNSWNTGQEMMDMILDNAAKHLYEHYIDTKLSDHIINASY